MREQEKREEGMRGGNETEMPLNAECTERKISAMLSSPTPPTSLWGFWKSTWWIWKSVQPWRTTTMEDLHAGDGLARA